MLSPSTARIDRARKMRRYAAARVSHVWLVDPAATTLEVYHLDGDTWRLLATHEGDAHVRAQPFHALELELGALWSR